MFSTASFRRPAAVSLYFVLAFCTFTFSQTLTVLHTFNSRDGQFPDGGLVHGSDGNLYGTTSSGGAHGNGTVFKITPSGKFISIYNFAGGGDGAYPMSSVIRDSAGNIYGTTQSGGPADNLGGVVFKITSSGHESVLHAFTGGADGGNPEGDLIRDSSGNLYGTTRSGGDKKCKYDSFAVGCGVVFKLDAAGTETVLHTFEGGLDGANPWGGLVMDSAGNLYGTTERGGRHDAGQVFKIDRARHKIVVHDFDPGFHMDGKNPRYGLSFGPGGILYGVTPIGGDVNAANPVGNGTVFKVDVHNVVTTIYSFEGLPSDGYVPDGPVARDAAGNLYGTTAGGGANDAGTVYKVDPSGNETILYNFIGGTDGWEPSGRLYVTSSGTVFGTASLSSDIDGYGVIFKITP
jgi:uncharacterized repeat protein (TIGR03803 family)